MTTKKIKATNTAGKLGYAAGVELSGLGDIARTNAGVDPYTGEELTPKKRTEEYLEWLVTPNISYGISKIPKIGNSGSNVYNAYNDTNNINKGYDKLENK